MIKCAASSVQSQRLGLAVLWLRRRNGGCTYFQSSNSLRTSALPTMSLKRL
jgi:hypothetical protein